MYGRAGGLDRFKKAQSLEPFSVAATSQQQQQQQQQPKSISTKTPQSQSQSQSQSQLESIESEASAHVTPVGGGQSSWQPPDWAIEPRPGLLYLDVVKDGVVLDRIQLQNRRHIFGRQFHTCDFVLDHQSVSRQHAAVVPHKNGSVYVVDLGSAHGTFVSNERLTKDTPVELEVGQSLRFAASTRSYVLRKNDALLFPPTPDINLPPPPDPSDHDAVVAYNTLINRYGLNVPNISKPTTCVDERPPKRIKKTRVAFRDQVGGELVQLVGISDGADVETQPAPLGFKEGSLVGKYESLVQITVIPKGKEHSSLKDDNVSPKGVTDKLLQVFNKVRTPNISNTGIYDDLYPDTSGKVGSSWAYSSATKQPSSLNTAGHRAVDHSVTKNSITPTVAADEDDDLFGD